MKTYGDGEITIRGNTVEGHRSYVAFHPPEYFERLVKDFEILAFSPGDMNSMKAQQDVWVLRKN